MTSSHIAIYKDTIKNNIFADPMRQKKNQTQYSTYNTVWRLREWWRPDIHGTYWKKDQTTLQQREIIQKICQERCGNNRYYMLWVPLRESYRNQMPMLRILVGFLLPTWKIQTQNLLMSSSMHRKNRVDFRPTNQSIERSITYLLTADNLSRGLLQLLQLAGKVPESRLGHHTIRREDPHPIKRGIGQIRLGMSSPDHLVLSQLQKSTPTIINLYYLEVQSRHLW